MSVKVIVLNNHELGKISKEQRAGEFDVWKTPLSNPNFAKYANSCGAMGVRVEKEEELLSTMEKIMNHKGPALLEIITDVNLI